MKGLFLDDERSIEDVTWVVYPRDIEWTIVRSFDEFALEISLNDFNIISFDHDLQDFHHGEEYTGMTCLKHLIEYIMDELKPMPYCLFHTQNIVGRDNMKALYENYLKITK